MEQNHVARKLGVLILLIAGLALVVSMGKAAEAADFPFMNEYPLPAGAGTPEDIVAAGPGNVWFTLHGGDYQVGQLIVTAAPDNYDFNLYDLPGNNEAAAITFSGNFAWVTVPASNSLVRVNSATGATQSYSLPVAGSQPAGIAAAPNGTLWIAATGANRVFKFTPSSPAFTQYAYPSAAAGITEIAVQNDDAIIFTAVNLDRAVRLRPSQYPTGPAFTSMPLQDPRLGSLGAPGQVAANDRGDIWLVAAERDWLGTWNFGTTAFWQWKAVPPEGEDLYGLALSRYGSANLIWFTLPDAGLVGHFGRGAVGDLFFREHRIPTTGSIPRSIAVDANNHGWIAVAGSNLIAEWLPGYTFTTNLPLVVNTP